MENAIQKFYENILGLSGGWIVEAVEQDNLSEEVTIRVVFNSEGSCKCPKCDKEAALYGTRERTLRHSDTCEYKTFLKVRYPRVKCPTCGIQPIAPPFAAANSRFTKDFELRIIALCHSSNVQKIAKDLGLNWHAIEGIKNRAYRRGVERLRRSPARKARNIAIDEVSFARRHDYSTVISDADRGHVIAVLPGRDSETLSNWFATQLAADFSELKSISIDMAPPYIKAIQESFPNADELICFDRFHVAQLFNHAVDTVRRKESAKYKKGKNPLTGTRFEWLRNDGKADNRKSKRKEFHELAKKPLETAKAWRLKEHASRLWDYKRESTAEKAWLNLYWRLSHSRIRELQKLGKTVRKHLEGILNAVKLRANNGIAEARNSCIQRAKSMACGYRDKDRFNREIIFQFGRLNMGF